MHRLYDLKEKLVNELEGYSENGKFSKEDAESIKNLSGAVDHLCNIIEGYEEEGYSNEMTGGTSYARGGRGSNRGGGRRGANQYGSYAMRGRYSMAEDNKMYVQELRELAEDAPNEKIKREFHELIKKIEYM